MLKNKTLDNARTLVLNADYRPLSTFPLSLWRWQRSVEAVYKGKVSVIEEWEDLEIRSAYHKIRMPKVVMYNRYVPLFRRVKPPVTRLSLALRDNFSCGYCGKKTPVKELTFDHVVPRSKGGKNTADNLLMACVKCNTLKANEDINPHGVKGLVKRGNFVPLRMPYEPTYVELYNNGINFIPKELREIFGEWLPKATGEAMKEVSITDWSDDSSAYWNVEIEP